MQTGALMGNSLSCQLDPISIAPSDGEVREWTEELQVHKPTLLPSEGPEAFQCALRGSAERHQVGISSVVIKN